MTDQLMMDMLKNPLEHQHLRRNFLTFIKRPIFIRVNQKLLNAFLVLAENAGIKWINGSKPTAFVPMDALEGAGFGFLYAGGHVGMHYYPYAKVEEMAVEYNYAIVEFEDFFTKMVPSPK